MLDIIQAIVVEEEVVLIVQVVQAQEVRVDRVVQAQAVLTEVVLQVVDQFLMY